MPDAMGVTEDGAGRSNLLGEQAALMAATCWCFWSLKSLYTERHSSWT